MSDDRIGNWANELGTSGRGLDGLRAAAIEVITARATRDPAFRELLQRDPRAALRSVGAHALVPDDKPVVVAPAGALVLHLPRVPGPALDLSTAGLSRFRMAERRKDDGPIDPPDPPPDPSPRVYGPFAGSGHHWANNPFSGGHKGVDVWTVTLPVGVRNSQVGIDQSDQVSIERVEQFATSGGEFYQETLKVSVRWWYNMWSDVRYRFVIFSHNQSATSEYYLGQDDSAPSGPKTISWENGFIQRFLDGRDLDDSIVITPV
jgi:hypothetical protein